jgi:hypothetical protein
MPIVKIYLNEGDPTIQAHGEYRGVLNAEFDDGRIITKHLSAPDEDAWSAKILQIENSVELEVQRADAEEAAENDVEILSPYRQASLKQMAVAYLRKAQLEPDPYLAYLKFSRFNDWRTREGYTLAQVESALASEGLTSEEWQNMRDRYTYLSNPARVTAMQTYQDILAGDVWAI